LKARRRVRRRETADRMRDIPEEQLTAHPSQLPVRCRVHCKQALNPIPFIPVALQRVPRSPQPPCQSDKIHPGQARPRTIRQRFSRLSCLRSLGPNDLHHCGLRLITRPYTACCDSSRCSSTTFTVGIPYPSPSLAPLACFWTKQPSQRIGSRPYSSRPSTYLIS